MRNAAITAIGKFGRPITAHELETWIAENDKDLCNAISEKCYDYVRIILSLTPATMITKYKAYESIPGVDKRAAFYGLADQTYDSEVWTAVKRKGSKPPKRASINLRNKSKIARSDGLERHQSSIFYQPEYSVNFMPTVDDSHYWYAWNVLMSFLPLTDPFWATFLQAIEDVEKSVTSGAEPESTLFRVLGKYPSLTYPVIINSVVTVLSRTAINCYVK